MTSTRSKMVEDAVKADVGENKDVSSIQGRDVLNDLFEKFDIPHSQTGNEDADIIEDWTSFLIWLTEKGVKKELLSKNQNTVMLGILCAAAERLVHYAGGNKPFLMMLTVNAANRSYFQDSTTNPVSLFELAQEQREVLGEYSEWREYIADITNAIDELFEKKQEMVRIKIAVAVSGLLKSAWSVLGMRKQKF